LKLTHTLAFDNSRDRGVGVEKRGRGLSLTGVLKNPPFAHVRDRCQRVTNKKTHKKQSTAMRQRQRERERRNGDSERREKIK